MRKAKVSRHVAGLMAAALLLCLGRTAIAGSSVRFDDPNLEAAVEATLGKTSPTPADMLALTSLYSYRRGISALTGLEYAVNLKSLSLPDNQVGDLSPLKGLTSLTELLLSGNQISDVSSLAGLTNLTELGLAYNQISDLSPLAGLTDLAELGLADNQVQDISPLADLTHLRRLDLLGNPLSDDACAIYIPQILLHNVGIDLLYDGCVDRHALVISPMPGGSVSDPGEGSFEYDDGTVVPVVAAAESGWHFVVWMGTAVDAGKVADPTSASTTVTMDDDYTLHADFVSDQHTLTITRNGDGTVKTVVVFEGVSSTLLGEGAFVLDHEAQVAITATAGAGWQFARWTGTMGSGESTLEFTLTGDVSLVAHFVRNPRTLAVTSGRGGQVVQPGVGALVYEQGSTVVIEAVCDRDYGFAGWTGTAADKGYVADPCRSRTEVTLHEDATLHANFEPAVRQFHESWETAEIGVYTPSGSTIFGGDEGPWAVGDGVWGSRTCGPTPNRAEVLALDGCQVLLLTSNDSNSACSDTVWAAMDESGLVREGSALPLDPNTIISFYQVGLLDVPALHGSGRDCEIPPCFDNVSLLLTDSRGSVLAYVLQRPGEAVANVPNAYLGGVYREVFLDPSGVRYQRNVFDDFRTIPAFNPRDSVLSSIEFRVGEHGSAVLDDLVIGPGAVAETIPVYDFWSPVLESRFFTMAAEEKQVLIDVYPDFWQFDGISCFTPAPGSDPNLAPVYRFWSPVHLSHFYTISESERDLLVSQYPDAWTLEGVAFYVFAEGGQPANTVPVYRFWAPTLGDHLYTLREEEKEDLLRNHSDTWSFEGVAWYAYPPTWDSAGAMEILRSSSAK